jgi:FKBP-type peptidyl-prolyl cis-trans isomerase
MKYFKSSFILFLSFAFIVACKSDDASIELPEGIDIVDTERGSGPAAKANDFVEVHYVGYFPESMIKFDSSYDRGRPLPLELGAGQVIKGWDLGIQGMRVGGKRTLTIAPEFAYGERGAGDVIPGNATLLFEVEMVSIKERPKTWSYRESQLTETESGLRYRIVTEGEGEPTKNGDVLTVYYAGFFEDGEMFDTSLRNPVGFRYQLGTGMAIPGFEEGLLGMKKGEERLLILSPDLAYGDEGVNGAIPPNSTLYFNVRIEDIR